MKQFEYQTIIFPTPSGLMNSADELNKLGKKGWELVSMTPSFIDRGTMIEVIAVLKREIEKK